ncbi:MAG: crotonase/enoyl-CoA hydratase family protein [Acidimicrobiaceae bacterium]|nr:crotonase/enoyl-CoA hydratase family protein [Acidimicrobiaceae bacterium]
MEEVVRAETIGRVLVVTLNRPDARNAINAAVAKEIEEQLDRLERDHSLWVGVLTGSPPAFSAGADLKEIAAGQGAKLSTARGGFAGIVERSRKKPLIAAVEGAALAGGCEIVLACDLIVAGQSASFGLPEVKRSLVAGGGGLFRLFDRLPSSIATEMILTGNPIAAPVAEQFGMVNRLSGDGNALEAALNLAEQICENAPLSVWESLGVTQHYKQSRDAELFKRSSEALIRVMQSEDLNEGLRAFIEKRAPNWAGK